jgi:putative SOS response-associated peptidase YedK
MCGRFQIDINQDRLAQIFGVPEITAFHRRWNVAPTQRALVIREREDAREAAKLRWGLVPSWADDESIGSRMINARAETARTKPAYRAAFASRRCLIPATGFYEWKQIAPKRKQPFLITPRGGEILALAGLWERWSKGGDPLETFTILTTEASEDIRELHERMPVALPGPAWDAWLSSEDQNEAEALLEPLPPSSLDSVAVSTRVNSPANDEPSVAEPAADVDPETGEERTLFG